MSKVQKTKAIHNYPDVHLRGVITVVSMSKVQKTKAIHNFDLMRVLNG